MVGSLLRNSLARSLALILPGTVAVMVASTVVFHFLTDRFIADTNGHQEAQLVQMVTVARQSLEDLLDDVRQGRVTVEQGRELARQRVRQMIYTDEYGPNYFFLGVYDGVMLVQPFEPHKEMTNLLDLRDPNGVYMIREIIARAQSKEEKGFVSYFYPMPGTGRIEAKRTYVVGIPELKCYLGTGMYLEGLQREHARLLSTARRASIFLMLFLLAPVFAAIFQLYRHNLELARQISMRERTESVLNETEARYKTLFETSTDALFIMRGAVLLDCNETAVKMFGVPSKDYLKAHSSVDLSPEVQPDGRSSGEAASAHIRACLAGSPQTFEWIHLRADGTQFFAEVNLHLAETDGEPLLFSSVRDVTDRKRAEEELRNSENRFRLLFNRAPMALAYVSQDGRLMDANQMWTHLFGYSIQDVPTLEDWWIRAYPDPDLRVRARNSWSEAIEEALSAGEEILPGEYLVTCRDGEQRTVLIGASVFGEDFLASFLDISQRKRSEEALRSSEGKLRSLFAAMSDLIIVMDSQGRYIEVPPTRSELLVRPRETIADHTLADFFDASKVRTFLNAIQTALSTRVPLTIDYDLEIGEKTFWFSAVISPLSEDRVIVVARDITERKESENERAHLQTQLLQAQKMEAIGQLAGGVAHDFNNMLQAILGYLGMLRREITPSELASEYLDEIGSAAERSANLTRQLLAFARKQTVMPVVMDLNSGVEQILKMLTRLIGEEIDLVWRPGIPLWTVKMDPAQLDQILANLCVNARDAIDGVGKITIETRNATFDAGYAAMHAEVTPGDYVQLCVADTGSGMDQNSLTKIFEPFYTTKMLGKGTGLGLATVYGIVKQNEGFISVYSELGVGTTFKIFLPRHVGGSVEEASAPVEETPKARGERILLVEDEPTILRMTRLMLEGLGYSVLSAATPSEACMLASETLVRIDLLLTDVIMPEMNGRELAVKLSSIHPEMKKLFMSGYTANVIEDKRVLDAGVHFITKPFSVNDLSVKLRTILD